MEKFDLKDWIAADGLMSLNKGGRRPSYLPPSNEYRMNTADNDNGILGIAHFLALGGEIEPAVLLETMALTKRWGSLGLYHRSAGRENYINSQDNYNAMAYICARLGNTEIFKEIIHNWPILNDMRPNWPHLKRWDWPSGIFQPSDWLSWYLVAGQSGGFVTTNWFVGNILYGNWKYPPSTHHSERLQTWIKCKTILLKQDLLVKGQKKYILWSIEKFKKKMISHGGIQTYFDYYNPEHPNNILSRGLTF